MRRIEAVFAGRRVKIVCAEETVGFTGCEKVWAVDAEPAALKGWMRAIEEQDDLGRLFDADVIGADGKKLSRDSAGEERRCLICGGPVRVCARARVHSADELFRRAHEVIEAFFRERFACRIAARAERALLYELVTTPKPGLVDCENSGAHRDMDRFTFVDSACALREYFRQCARIGIEHPDGGVFERLRHAGQQAEAEMLAATGGVNTHKGALFSLGLLSCAAGMSFGEKFSMDRLLQRTSMLAGESMQDFDRVSRQNAVTGGERQYAERGLTGVRGEAASGFRSVVQIAIPVLERSLEEGKNSNDAGLDALMALMREVPDSNVLRRGGEEGQRELQAAAAQWSGSADELHAMNEQFVGMNLSPGGCADLLAVAWFLQWLKESEV